MAAAWQRRVPATLAAWYELANVEDRLAYLNGAELRPPFDLGGLASAWPRASQVVNPAELRDALTSSAWGDPGGDSAEEVHLGLRASWAARLLADVPSDGTGPGTMMVKDINPAGNSNPARYGTSGGLLFFQATDGTNGAELWKSDGTTGGTVIVKDINPAGASSSPTILTDVNGTLFLVAIDADHGEELWKTNGTPEGTVAVKPGTALEPGEELGLRQLPVFPGYGLGQ